MRDEDVQILVVDDEGIARENIGYVLDREGYCVLMAENGQRAIHHLEKNDIDLVLTDLRMKGKDGFALLGEVKRRWPDTEVIVITGFATVDTAVAAMHQGAYHYLAKPVKIDELLVLVRKALEKRALQLEVFRLRDEISMHKGLDRIIGQSPSTQLLRESIKQMALHDCNVLILGETGTGKELVAKLIHQLSPRVKKRFMAFNCGAFTEEIISNELFGHEKGSFTGALQIKKGLLELAEGGTVFFDEVGELSLAMQVKLLRFLQERTIMRLGGTEEIPVDVRVLAATNRDLKRESLEGRFRVDLFYRLDVLTIRVPTLHERKEDIPLLVKHFLAKHASSPEKVPLLAQDVLDMLQEYEYPGNIRELENIAQRLLLHGGKGKVDADWLRKNVAGVPSCRRDIGAWPSLEEQEKNYICEVLDQVHGNKSVAAKILKIDRVSLWRKIKRYGVDAHGRA